MIFFSKLSLLPRRSHCACGERKHKGVLYAEVISQQAEDASFRKLSPGLILGGAVLTPID